MTIQFKLPILTIALLSGFMYLNPTIAFAQCPTTNPSDLPNITKQAVESASEVKTLQNLTVEDDKQKTAVNGNANCKNSPENTQGIKTTAYDYLKEKVLNNSKSGVVKPQKNYNSAIKEIKETFFVEGEGESGMSVSGIVGGLAGGITGISTSKSSDALEKRLKYVNEVASSSLAHSVALRKKVQEDIQSVSKAQTSGCNQLQGYLLQNRNLQALIKATAADIVVQVLIMEAHASQNLLKEPATLIEYKEEVTSTATPSGGK